MDKDQQQSEAQHTEKNEQTTGSDTQNVSANTSGEKPAEATGADENGGGNTSGEAGE